MEELPVIPRVYRRLVESPSAALPDEFVEVECDGFRMKVNPGPASSVETSDIHGRKTNEPEFEKIVKGRRSTE